MAKFERSDIFLVTGASSGIGRQTALRINELGGSVIATARRAQKLADLKEKATHPDSLFIEEKDLSKDLDDLPKWVLSLSKKYGKLKGVVMAAGVCQIFSLKAISIQKTKELFDINFFSNLALAKGFCDKRVNIGSGSSMVFVSSVGSMVGEAGLSEYSASKGAINSAVRSLAMEHGKLGIRVNSVLPGIVRTEMIEMLGDIYDQKYLDEMSAKYPLGLGNPQDVADPICFLLADEARWITGQNIVIDGGGSL